MSARTILIADDHPLMRAALREAASRASPGAIIIEAGSLGEARAAAKAQRNVSLVLLDLMMGDSRGLAGLLVLRADHPDVPVVVVSAAEDAETAAKAIDCGASGFIPKSSAPDAIVEALQAVLDGDIWNPFPAAPAAGVDLAARFATLTPAQLRVLIGLMDGRLNKQIAWDMGISEATVKAHVTAVFRKLHVQNRTQAVIAARTLGVETAALEAV